MRNLIVLLFFIPLTLNTFAQVGGLSASKLATLNAETVKKNTIEFEPSFGFYNSRYHWDNSSKLHSNFINNDSATVSSSVMFRFSYGLTNNIEIGVSICDNISNANWGIKYNFFSKNKSSAAFILGANTPLGNRNVDLQTKSNENSIATGIIFSQNINKKLSLDVNTQYQHHFFIQKNNHLQDYFINFDLGYYIIDKIQLVSGFNYMFSDGLLTKNSLVFNPGITIEKAKNFILVMQLPYTIYGRNSQKSLGFGLALTIFIE